MQTRHNFNFNRWLIVAMALLLILLLAAALVPQTALAALPVSGVGETALLAQSPSTESAISVVTDGVPPWDALDAADDNGIVRNFDLITYRVEVSINDADDTNVHVFVDLNDKAKWTDLPDICKTSGVTPISELVDTNADGLEDRLICNLGDHPQGTKLIFSPIAVAVGNDDDVIQADVCSNSDNNANTGGTTTAQCDGPVETTIKADFQADLDKSVNGLPVDQEINYRPPYIPESAPGSGDDGHLIEWHIALNYAVGSEFIANTGGSTDFVLTDSWVATHDDVGDITGTDNFQIYSCSAVDPTATYSVVCTQPGGPGTDVSIAIDGVDVRDPQPFNVEFAMWIPISDITQNDVYPSASIEVDNTATITSFNDGSGTQAAPLKSVNAVTNPGVETDDADYILNVVPPGQCYGKTFDGMPCSSSTFHKPKSGQRAGAKDELIETSIYLNERLDLFPVDQNRGICEIIDTDLFEFAGVDPVQKDSYLHGASAPFVDGATPIHQNYNPASITIRRPPNDTEAYAIDPNAVGGTNAIIIEYSDTANGAGAAYWDTVCTDAGNNWVTDYTSLTGGAASVTKVRMKFNKDYSALIAASNFGTDTGGLWSLFSFNLKVKNSVTISTGDELRNIASFSSDTTTDIWEKAEDSETYGQTPGQPLYSFNNTTADRVTVVDAHMGIVKSVATPPGGVRAGDTVVFTIDAFTAGTAASPTDLTIVDTLSSELLYVSDTCAAEIPGCTVDLSGLPGTVTWTIAGHSVGTDLPPFDLVTLVDAVEPAPFFGFPFLINTVDLSADDGGALAAASTPGALTSSVQIPFVPGQAGTQVSKSVSPTQVDLTGSRTSPVYTSGANDFTYSLTYANLGGDFLQGHLIDVLPYNGDSGDSVLRDPASSFAGFVDFVSITGSNGETFEYSTDAPATLHHEPCHPDNWPAGATIATDATMAEICTGGLLDVNGDTDAANAGTGATTWNAGLPTTQVDKEATTAIRVTVPSFPSQAPSRTLDLVLRGAGNASGDAYCNNYAAQINQELDEISNDVCVTVNVGLDWGDAPDTTTNAPSQGDYNTTAADNGPSHVIVPDLYLGSVAPDADDGTNQDVPATADDNDASPNDEEGITPANKPQITPTSTGVELKVNATNNTNTAATLACWVDFNRDGDFTDTGERAATADGAVTAASGLVEYTLNFAGFSAPVLGDSYIRCRIAHESSELADPVGPANSGEVEDCLVAISELDYGDAPDTTTNAPSQGDYNTTAADNGPSHVIVPDLYLGSVAPDADDGTNQDVPATADDNDASPNDEEGITPANKPQITPTSTGVELKVNATNNTNTAATLACWVDFNRDGDFTDTGERAATADGAVTAASGLVEYTLNFAGFSAPVTGDSYIRCRIAHVSSELTDPVGPANSGEVEDCLVAISGMDYGDAPDSDASYPNQTVNPNGAYHLLNSELVLGTCVDSEADGVPVPAGAPSDLGGGNSDNSANGTASPFLPDPSACDQVDDEDGYLGTNDTDWSDGSGSIDVKVSGVADVGGQACVYGWIDFDQNGFDASDVASTMLFTSDGTQEMVFDTTSVVGSIPVGVPLYMRLRVVPGACGSLDPTGPATGGEVEDHHITTSTPTAVDLRQATTTLPSTNLVWIIVATLVLLTAIVVRLRRREENLD